MTNEQLHAALLQAGGPAFYDVAPDASFIIIDGAFTLEEIAALGDVALKAMNKPAEESEAKAGDQIRVTVASASGFYFVGDYATLLAEDHGVPFRADFNDPRNPVVCGDGNWWLPSGHFEVIR